MSRPSPDDLRWNDTVIAKLRASNEKAKRNRDNWKARALKAERRLRLYELERQPCMCGGMWSASGSTFTRCDRCTEIDDLSREEKS